MSTPELLEIRGLARSFAEAELRPHAERWDAARSLDDGTIAKIAELGFLGMLVPESTGGMGFDPATYVAALEELAWGEPGAAMVVAQSVVAADLLTHARAGGRSDTGAVDALVAQLAAGERIGCIAFAEDEAGTDLSRVITRAERSGDAWTVTGRKRWVTNGARADVAIVLAATDDGQALFSVGTDGRTAGEVAATMGLRSAPVTDITFDAAPAEHIMDVTGDARAQVDRVGRLSAAAIAVGIAQAALDHAVAYAAERQQFGQPLRAFEGIRFKLAGMATRTAAARALLERAAADTAAEAAGAMAKLAAGEAAMHVTTEAVQVFGGYGYMKDYPVEKLMRDAKAMEIVHGTSEMQRLRIAAALYAD